MEARTPEAGWRSLETESNTHGASFLHSRFWPAVEEGAGDRGLFESRPGQPRLAKVGSVDLGELEHGPLETGHPEGSVVQDRQRCVAMPPPLDSGACQARRKALARPKGQLDCQRGSRWAFWRVRAMSGHAGQHRSTEGSGAAVSMDLEKTEDCDREICTGRFAGEGQRHSRIPFGLLPMPAIGAVRDRFASMDPAEDEGMARAGDGVHWIATGVHR